MRGYLHSEMCARFSVCVCVWWSIKLEIYHGRSCPSSLNMFTCVILSVLMQSTFLSSNLPGAAGARLLSGQSKPVAMDVDEEENMSESAQIFLICPSVCPCSCLCGTFKCLLVLLFPFFLSACVSSLLRPSVFLCCVISVDTVWLLT